MILLAIGYKIPIVGWIAYILAWAVGAGALTMRLFKRKVTTDSRFLASPRILNAHLPDMYFDQRDFDIKCEWGLPGIERLSPYSDVIIIVDVLSFSTCVDVAVKNGALVYPYRWRDGTAEAFAASIGGALARSRRQAQGGYSLSPVSLLVFPPVRDWFSHLQMDRR